MSKPFDATLKDLGAADPAAFLTLFDIPPAGPLRLLNVDLSTVTTAGDLVIGLGDPLREIIHFEFRSSADADKGCDVLVHSALLYRQYRVPIHGVLVLLRPQAAHSAVSGHIRYAARPGLGNMDYGYQVVSLWLRSAEELLRGPVGTLPLAMLGMLPEGVGRDEGLADLAERLWRRIKDEAPLGQAARLRVSAFEMMCLRVKRIEARAILMDIPAVRESEGILLMQEMATEIRLKKDILRLGRSRLGQEDEAAHARLDAEHDLERLERYFDRLVDAPPPSWQDLLDTP